MSDTVCPTCGGIPLTEGERAADQLDTIVDRIRLLRDEYRKAWVRKAITEEIEKLKALSRHLRHRT